MGVILTSVPNLASTNALFLIGGESVAGTTRLASAGSATYEEKAYTITGANTTSYMKILIKSWWEYVGSNKGGMITDSIQKDDVAKKAVETGSLTAGAESSRGTGYNEHILTRGTDYNIGDVFEIEIKTIVAAGFGSDTRTYKGSEVVGVYST